MISRANIETVINGLEGYSPNPANQPKFEWFHEPYQLPEEIAEGSRNAELLSFAGHLRAKGLSEVEILARLLSVNHHRCKPPLPYKEVIDVSGRYERAANDSAYSTKRRRSGFMFMRASEMEAKSTSFLAENFIEENSLSAFVGASGSGKSLLSIQLACAIAGGVPWCGKQTKQGSVFYIAGEGMNGLARRIRVAAEAMGLKKDELDLFCSNMSQGFTDPEAARFVAEQISQLADQYGPPALIVLDTLARNFGDGDENSARDMGLFVQNLDEHLRTKFDTAVLLVHHTGHAEQTRGRGSSALNAALDTSYLIAKDQTGIVRMSCTKAKEFPEPPPMAFKIMSEGSGAENAGYLQQVTYSDPSKSAGLGQNQSAVLSVLNDLLRATERPVRLERLRAECEAVIDQRGFRDAYKGLSSRSLIFELNGYVHTEHPDNWEFDL